MTDSGRNTTHKRLVHSWRISWAASIFVLVEIIVCGLSALPAVILWSWLATVLASSPRLLQVILLSVALVPSYIIFALALLFISPVAVRLLGWRTPANAEMRIDDVDWPLLSFVRFAAANHFVRVLAGPFFRASPLWTAHLRLAGARLGSRVYINSLELNDYNLLEFEDDVVIGADVHLSGHTVEGGVVKTAPVHLGRNTTVGVGSIVDIGVTTGPNCEIGALTLVPKHMQLEADSVYTGIPAKRMR
jgi:acetyltransferase-like isoleucine patch superfamily enzyme